MRILPLVAIVCLLAVTVSFMADAAEPKVVSKDPPVTTKGGSETKISDEGTVIGTVARIGKGFIEVTSTSGKRAHYIPEWKNADHGPDREIVKMINDLKVGDKVSLQWYVNDHLRVKRVELAK